VNTVKLADEGMKALGIYIRDELYLAVEPTGLVCNLAWTADHIPSKATAEPMQIPSKFKKIVWRNLALGIMGTHRTVMIGMRYPSVLNVEATESA